MRGCVKRKEDVRQQAESGKFIYLRGPAGSKPNRQERRPSNVPEADGGLTLVREESGRNEWTLVILGDDSRRGANLPEATKATVMSVCFGGVKEL